MGVWAARIWLRVSSVGIPRSITQVRWAFPYCFSIFFRKSAKVVSSGVLPRPDLIGQWKAIRSHDQGDHHLHAIWTFVAAVTKFSFTFLGRIRFKIGTGQIVEKHLKTHIEQRLPALLEIGKQVLLMGQQLGPCTDTACRFAPDQNPPPRDHPSHFVQTSASAAATHYPDRSSGESPTS